MVEKKYRSIEEFFGGDELCISTYEKYRLKDKQGKPIENSPEQTEERECEALASVDEDPVEAKRLFLKASAHFNGVVGQGSVLYGAGNPYQISSLSNCTVSNSPGDSIQKIFKTATEQAQLTKRRCGCGFDLSELRPEGARTNNAGGSSSGAVGWANFFSDVCRTIGLDGRRGALMLTLSGRHPDVVSWALMKRDLKRVTGANVSIKIYDDFMRAVEKGEEYKLQWPVESDNPTIVKNIIANDVWKVICESAWLSAEPGLLFWDNITKNLPSDCYEKTISTNPCQPGWSKLLTPDGIRELKDIAIGQMIWSRDGWTKVVKKWSTGIKKVFKYKTSAGIFYGTENHKIVSEGEKIEAKDAESIDILRGKELAFVAVSPQDIMDGLVIGDGSLHKASNNLVHLYIGQDDQDYFQSEIKHLIGKHRPGLKETAYEIKTTVCYQEIPKTFYRRVPERFIKDNIKLVGFLRGIYSANGSVCDNRVTLKSTSFGLVEDVQLMLSSVGIKSYITTNQPAMVKFSNGEYICKKSHDLNITTDRMKFKYLIGFIQRYKNDKIIETRTVNRDTHEIQEVSFISEEEVFDITVDNKSHTYWTQGCNVSNCSEIGMSRSSCRLISEGLPHYVNHSFTRESEFDFVRFEEDTRIGMRMNDNLVSLEMLHIKKIMDVCDSEAERDLWQSYYDDAEQYRRTGLGLHGWADMFIRLGIRYDSDKAKDLARKVSECFRDTAYDASIELAKLRGPFPGWDWEKEKDCEFFKRMPVELIEKMKKYGRRNVSLLTIAPTGSISILSQCLAGDTNINTLNGLVPIKELVGKKPYVYCEKDGDVYVAQASKVWKTRSNASVWKIVLDDDTFLLATKEHKIRLSDGSYKKIEDLKLHDSITHFNKITTTQYNEPRTSIGITGNYMKYEHRLIAQIKLGRFIKKKEVVHHIDENTLNNNFDNLQILKSQSEHSKLHRHLAKWSESHKGQTYQEIYETEKAMEIRRKMRKAIKRNGGVWNTGKPFSKKVRGKISKATKIAMKDPIIRQRYLEGMEKSGRKVGNHIVIKIMPDFVVTDVYDMEVPETHNFVANNIVVHNCSSGIEPIFRIIYKRRKKINHNDIKARIDYTDEMGDKWQEYEVIHWSAQEYMAKTGKNKHELPDYFIESDKVDWKKKIDLVGIVQSNIDHGISQTLNLPKSATVETVSELYFHAWKAGLKGFTIYRDGSRSGVLLTKGERPDKISRHEAPKRPDILPCDIHHVTVQGKPWIVMVGKLDDQPYEIFAGRANKVKVPPKYDTGKIIKEKHSYLLEFNDEMRLDIIECFDNEEEQAVSRLLSMSMRHGVPLAYIIDQLDKVEDKDITTFNKAIMRVLKKYMKDEDAGLLKCKDCGQATLVMENGCYTCKSCGASKCS